MNAFSSDTPKVPAPNKADILAHLTALFPPEFVHPYPDALIEIAYGMPNPNKAELFSAFELNAAAEFAVIKNLSGCNARGKNADSSYVFRVGRAGKRYHADVQGEAENDLSW